VARRAPYHLAVVPEAPFEESEHGRVRTGEGWYVLNARDARWWDRDGQGFEGSLMAGLYFEQVAVGLNVLGPGQPMAMYHWETDQEDFFVLAGEAVLIIEGEERRLKQWDFVHCPPGTKHAIVGASDEPCVVFALGALEHHTYRDAEGAIHGRDDWGAYTVDDTAVRHGAGVEEETTDADIAYARFPKPVPTRYRDGLLPD
jgi:uncharacterized cupin superfamily protein